METDQRLKALGFEEPLILNAPFIETQYAQNQDLKNELNRWFVFAGFLPSGVHSLILHLPAASTSLATPVLPNERISQIQAKAHSVSIDFIN